MESFKVNRAYCEWAERAKLPENMNAEYNAAASIAEDCLMPDSTNWESITVLYSFPHGITGENMHFVRVDSVSTTICRDGTRKIRPYSEHKTITESELQQYKKYIVDLL